MLDRILDFMNHFGINKFWIICLLCLSSCISHIHGQFNLSGIVVADETNEPLPSVVVQSKKHGKGVLTDLDGKFTFILPLLPDSLYFSCVGYAPSSIFVISATNNIQIRLTQQSLELAPILIKPEENPAHRIIRLANTFMDRNRPESNQEFRYKSYNKLRLAPMKNSSYFKHQGDPNVRKVDSVFNTMDMLLWESVTERRHKRPEKTKEIVLASRLSGLKGLALPLSPTDLQDLSFYSNWVKILGVSYMSPIADQAIEKYDFTLAETVIDGLDTLFVIQCKPFNSQFSGLTGSLTIDSRFYGIRSIEGTLPLPADKFGFESLTVKQIHQFLADSIWFPYQLYTDIIWPIELQPRDSMPEKKLPLVLTVRSYIKEIELVPMLSRKDFDPIVLAIVPDAAEKGDDFWNRYRNDSLTIKDIQTYKIVDSIGQKAKFNQIAQQLGALIEGRVRIKMLDLDLFRLYRYNPVEAHRIGVGLFTNYRWSEAYTIGAWVGYGTGDERMKWGLSCYIHPFDNKFNRLHFEYQDDLVNVGEDYMLMRPFDPSYSQSFYRYQIRDFYFELKDYIRSYKASLFWLSTLNIHHECSISHEERNSSYRNLDQAFFRQSIAELTFQTSIGIGEKYVNNGLYLRSNGSKYPKLAFRFIHGISTQRVEHFSYQKFELALFQKISIGPLISFSYHLSSGIFSGEVPFNKLYFFVANGSPVAFGRSNSFNTMEIAPSEMFSSSRYFSGFVNLAIENASFPSKHYSPDPFIRGGYAVGNHVISHSMDFDLHAPSLGFSEIGTGLFNFWPRELVKQVPSLAFMGLGVYASLGAYAPAVWRNRLNFKIEQRLIF